MLDPALSNEFFTSVKDNFIGFDGTFTYNFPTMFCSYNRSTVTSFSLSGILSILKEPEPIS